MRGIAGFLCLVIAGTLGCASSGSNGTTTSSSGERATAAKSAPAESEKPGKIGIDAEEIPASVRQMEQVIDENGVILTDEAEISVSKNYQLDVSLTGDDVSVDKDDSGAVDRTATGKPTAWIRNLQIRADQKIRVRIADVGTRPFIKIVAKGNCAHLTTVANGTPEVRRAAGIVIENNDLRYVEAAPAEKSPA